MKLNRRILGLVYDSCDGHCYYCGESLDPFGQWDLDHMTPIHQGGPDVISNLVLACRRCNRSKGSWTVAEFSDELKMRAWRHLAKALQTLGAYPREPGTEFDEAFELIHEAMGKVYLAHIRFFGEIYALPRNNDPNFDAKFFAEVCKALNPNVLEDPEDLPFN